MKFKSILEMFVLSAVWGASFILIRLSGEDLPPVWVAFGRLALGSLFLWTVLALGRHRLPPLRFLGPLIVAALLNNSIPFCLFAWGEQTVPSSIASIINATTPIWALVFGLAIGSAQATRLTAAGVFLGFLGVLGVVYGQSSALGASANIHSYFFGAILISCATMSYGAGAVAARRWLHGVEPVVIAALQLTLAALALLPLAAFGPHPTALHWKSLAAITALGVLGSGLAYLLFFRLLATISPTRTTAVTYVLPIWGLFWGFIAGEEIRWTSLAGIAVVLAGLLLLNLPARKEKAATSAPPEPCPAEQR